MANDLLKHILKPSMDWLFVFIPITLWMEHSEASAPMVFFAAALSIIPIAHLIVHSTEKIAVHTGDAVGGLLNATFGNAPEIIISMVALRAGLYDLVLGSLAGAVLGNALFATGLAFLLGGMKVRVQQFNPQNARLLASMMLVAVVSLMVPSAFYRTFQSSVDAKLITDFNVWLAVLFLVCYVLYLVFTLRTHKDEFAAVGGGEEHTGPKPSLPISLITLIVGSVLAAFISEVLVGAAEATGEALGLSQVFIGMVVLALVGGAAEIFSAVAVARKDKLDMSLGITMGSCVQVVLFITPLLVLSSLFMDGPPFLITFGTGTIVAVLLTALMSAVITSDGNSQWFKGVQMLMVYLIIASMLYFVPELR
ncbi:MAG TPA: calcium/proton exchanger [Flavobacteriales bacterium]|nr:calcium/proton exchanger [Flavobacteriales bacterium]